MLFRSSVGDTHTLQRILGPVLAVGIGVGVIAVIVLSDSPWATGQKSAMAALSDTGNNTKLLAEYLFTDFLWPFEVTGVLLVIAVVGAVVLARRSRQKVESA